jgi:NTP pyrophosphatase (non-canonical NTP hydrolase)
MDIQALVGEVVDAWRKTESEEMYEPKYVVRETGDVGIVLLDSHIGLMIEQPSSTWVASRTVALIAFV